MGANAATFTSADGYRLTFPLSYLLEKGAMLVTKVGGEPLTESFGGVNQLWVPTAPSRLNIRDVVKVEFEELAEEPPVPSFETERMVFENRPNASVELPLSENPFSGIDCKAGETLSFEGYAYDYDVAVTAVQFSLDAGLHWTTYETKGATPERWVRWKFEYTPPRPGRYSLQVRSVNAHGTPGPHPSVCDFMVG